MDEYEEFNEELEDIYDINTLVNKFLVSKRVFSYYLYLLSIKCTAIEISKNKY